MESIARYIDHAVLKPEMTREESQRAILEGISYSVRTVCVRPCDIELAVSLCKGTSTDVSCVLAFPHGCVPSDIKAFEASKYIEKGVKEIDMVTNFGFIRSGLWDMVLDDITAVAEVTKKAGILLKVILETCTLNYEGIKRATELSIEAGADFVKTSTGFHSSGATEQAVKAMLDTAKGLIKVKASGGIRDFDTAKNYIEMGCERLGVGFTTTPVLVNQQGIAQDTY